MGVLFGVWSGRRARKADKGSAGVGVAAPPLGVSPARDMGTPDPGREFGCPVPRRLGFSGAGGPRRVPAKGVLRVLLTGVERS